ncbi:MAG: hypothetical protein EOM69_01040 [Clostridia bacterium]|nr:hypothetical protein [Clostridia bacterium]
MTITEKTAYLKGLLEGLSIDPASENGKLFSAIIDTMNEIALSVSDLEEDTAEMAEELEMIEDALDELDETVEAIDEDIDDLCDLLDECDCDDEDDEDYEEEAVYQVVCPTCGEEICVDEELLEEGMMKCPACGEELEFDLSDLEDDDEHSCDCGCDCGCEH